MKKLPLNKELIEERLKFIEHLDDFTEFTRFIKNILKHPEKIGFSDK